MKDIPIPIQVPRVLTTTIFTILFVVIAIISIYKLTHGDAVASPTRSEQRTVDLAGINVFMGIDRSMSARALLPSFAHSAAAVGANQADGTELRLYTLDFESQEFYSGQPEGEGELLDRIVAAVRRKPVKNGTVPETFWNDALLGVETSNKPAAILLYSDGDVDATDPKSIAKLNGTISKLAGRPNVLYVAAIGVRPENRRAMRLLLAPFGKRATIEETTVTSLGAVADNVDRQN